jgi:hypothetical protein
LYRAAHLRRRFIRNNGILGGISDDPLSQSPRSGSRSWFGDQLAAGLSISSP